MKKRTLSLSLSKSATQTTRKTSQSHTHFCTHIQKSIIMEELKASGNAAFKKGDFASAVDFFTRAIDAATLENHHVLYSNRSAARVRCCCRQKSSSSFSHRFKVVSILERAFFFGRRRQSLSFWCASKREAIGMCVGGRSCRSVWTLLEAIQTSSLFVVVVVVHAKKEKKKKKKTFRKDEKLFSSSPQKE